MEAIPIKFTELPTFDVLVKEFVQELNTELLARFLKAVEAGKLAAAREDYAKHSDPDQVVNCFLLDMIEPE